MKLPSGRIIGVFGVPCSGKTTIISALVGASKELIAHISSGDIARSLSTQDDTDHMANGNLFPGEDALRAKLLETIEKRRASGAELVFLDGFPRTAEQVKWLLDNRLAATPLDGCLVQVKADNLTQRAVGRMRDGQDSEQLIAKKIAIQEKEICAMDNIIVYYGIPYYTIMNTDLTNAVQTLAKIVGLRK